MTAVSDRQSRRRLSVVTAPGPTYPRHFRRRLRTPLLWALAGGWAAMCLALITLAYRDAQAGSRRASDARAVIGSGQIATAAERLEAARRSFDRAHRLVSSPVLAVLRPVPVLGRQIESFAGLAKAASKVAGIGAGTARSVTADLDAGHPGGAGRPALLRRLAQRAAGAEKALGEIRLDRSRDLLPALSARWAALDHDVSALRSTLASGAEGLDAVAGVIEGPRRYLLLAANNAEMRAGSGMFLSIGTVAMETGSLRLGPLLPAGELTLPGPGVAIDGDLAGRWGWLQPGREWRNLGTTPRFDATAPLAARMWESLTGERVDGALALDVPALEGLLAATGRLAVDGGILETATVSSRLLRDQYQGLSHDDAHTARREQLGQVAATVVDALDAGNYPLTRLGVELSKSARGRHLMAWSPHAGDQRAWELAGITGSLSSSSLAVGILNRGGNKLDPFLDVVGGIDLRPAAGGTAVTMRLRIANRAPAGQAPYLAGPHPQSGAAEGDYLGIVAVNLPADAADVAVDGNPRLVAHGRDGPSQVVAVPLLLPRDKEASVAVQFRLPASHTKIEVVPSARVPGVRWQAGDQLWRDDAAKVVSWRWE